MSDWYVTSINKKNEYICSNWTRLLYHEGILPDKNLDYTCGIFDDNNQLIATGSSFKNTLRCFAVDINHRGEGLLNLIVSHLISYQYEHGNTHIFVYTKYDSADFFKSLGFYAIAEISDQIVFMENRKNGFTKYLDHLSSETEDFFKLNHVPFSTIGAIVMNANPFTLGHKYLIEYASKHADIIHLFGVSEENNCIPYAVRKKLILDGCKDIPNIIYHDSGPYMISHATFPSYFQKDEPSVIKSHALLDSAVFSLIAKTLNIKMRYVGTEPTSTVTSIYNDILKKQLPLDGVSCYEIPRIKACGSYISASSVRQAIKKHDLDTLKLLVPQTTFDYFVSNDALSVITAIEQSDDLSH